MRTSTSGAVPIDFMPPAVMHRIDALLQLESPEDLAMSNTARWLRRYEVQVAQYSYAQHYLRHYDGAPSKVARISSLLLYLQDPEKGGETNFPRAGGAASARSSCASGLSVRPQAESALLFYNFVPREQALLEEDVESEHAGCAVEAGEKWVANVWVRWYGPAVFLRNHDEETFANLSELLRHDASRSPRVDK